MIGAGLLGILFALSFCPVSAALFFGSLIPLSLKHSSWLTLPACYGAGTGLPVVAAAVMVAGGAHGIGKTFESLAVISRWGQRVTGVVFLFVGAYYSWMYFGDFLWHKI